MLQEVNIINPTHKLFHSSIAASLREESRKSRPNRKPDRFKHIQRPTSKDKHGSESESVPDKEREVTPIYKRNRENKDDSKRKKQYPHSKPNRKKLDKARSAYNNRSKEQNDQHLAIKI